MSLSDRIKQARMHAGITQREVAERVGIAQTAISQLESGKTQRSTYLFQIAEACGVNSIWLVTGVGGMLNAEGQVPDAEIEKNFREGYEQGLKSTSGNVQENQGVYSISAWDDDTPLEDDEVEIPFLKEVQLSAGSGRTSVEQSSNAKLRFGKRSLRAHNVQFDQAVCVVVKGNSMEPVLPDGSTVGVNTGYTSVTDGKMYALKHDGQLRVKILYRLPGGGIRMRSFNQVEHPDETYSADEMRDKHIQIIGKVFWGASFF
ncbi:XRE family transcriptional regulator [Pseudomonas syringae]|uniref:XRE family transcriptional regulator n=1 Tax=Pseudomonas syringae TaxID=317 RepID=UPI000E30CD25|nr:S24 family peptidase [Pseudomonas syringae]